MERQSQRRSNSQRYCASGCYNVVIAQGFEECRRAITVYVEAREPRAAIFAPEFSDAKSLKV